jgi:hypothetical protein
MTSRTFATLSSVFDVDGHPKRGSSSTEVQPSLKRFHHSYVWVLHVASSPNAIFNISNVSVTNIPIFTQIRCLWKTLIFLSRQNRQTRQTCDHVKRHSTMTKQDRAMRFFSRRSSSNSLLERSTCSAPLGRHNGGLFWTIRNFPDSPCIHISFLNACTMLQKANAEHYHACLFIHLHGTTQLPLNKFSCDLRVGWITKNLSRKISLFKSDRNNMHLI